jgi:hypothetical protein
MMRYFLSLVVAATVLGPTPAISEEEELGACVRWVDSVVTIGTSLNNGHESMALIKEGESESGEMIAIIERNREDRERKVVIDR